MRALKAFADLVRTTSFGVRKKMGRILRLQLQRSLTKFMFARMERLPSAIYDMKWCSVITANDSQFRSARFESVKRHFGMLCACLMPSEQ